MHIYSYVRDIELMETLICSDIKFVLGSTRAIFYAHQCILMMRCEVFRAMLTTQGNLKSKDGKLSLVLSDAIPEVFTAMMQYIYTNCVTLNCNIVSVKCEVANRQNTYQSILSHMYTQ